jgi:hypothetical protein
MRSTLRILLPSTLLGLALAACTDDFGEPCDMPNTPEFNALCASDPERGTDATCVFSNSAQCSSRVCARFQGSTDFCSDFCTTDEECPGTAVCYAPPGAPGQAFCVPADVFTR